MNPIIVCEIGSNFEPGNLESALEMVRVAASVGADCVKFQDWRADSMKRPAEWKERCRPWEMNKVWIYALCHEALKRGLDFMCSVWDDESIWNSRRMYYPALKVAASEISNQGLLRDVNDAMFSEPHNVWLSVPHDRQGAVVPALTWLPDCRVTLLHCVSEYPAESPHYQSFDALAQFGLPIGWSSHCPYPLALRAAEVFAEKGAAVIEAHLRTKDTPENAPDFGPWSLWPSEFKELVDAVRGAWSLVMGRIIPLLEQDN